MGIFVEKLKKEHEDIRLSGSIAKQFCKRINQGEEVKIEDLDHLIEFLEIYSLKGHHEKEEKGLIPALEKAEREKEGKSLGAIVQDHATIKIHIEKIKENFTKYEEGEHQGLSGVVGYILNYLDFLYRHMEKEEKVFYPLADKVLSEGVQKELLKRFEFQDHEIVGEERLNRFKEKLTQLSDHYL